MKSIKVFIFKRSNKWYTTEVLTVEESVLNSVTDYIEFCRSLFYSQISGYDGMLACIPESDCDMSYPIMFDIKQ